MRSIQRGITTTFIIIIILAAAVSITAVYFTYTLKQKTSINSFEDCARLYPVMESYPEQCNTPEGKHFTRQLSDEEERQMSPAPPAVPMNIYTNSKFGYSLSYPADWSSKTAVLENSSPTFESPDIKYYEIFLEKGSRVFILVEATQRTLNELEEDARMYKPPSQSDAPQIIEIVRSKLSGRDAMRQISTRGMNALTYTLVDNQKQYLITCNYQAKDYASFRGCDSILNTFKLSE